MLKKIFKIFKFIIIGGIWTLVFLCFSRLLMVKIWQFDIFYKKQWEVMKGFWNGNGVIIGISDYMLFVTLFFLMLFWFFILLFLCRLNYFKLLLKPIEYISNREIKRYEQTNNQIVLKNMSVAEKITIEDVIKERIQQEKKQDKKVKEADYLRQNISEKIIKKKEQ